ncbi:Ppx/GppA phosphatase family protein [Pseudovibrio exalbescens]|uniref:Ppx/GppA family phosphatase n=1 Tax=Pseudovibrio exalbescens TaxID=197461 RepID=UPI002366DC13|nr:Ppx/GppA phosphatase family protein [Pseudovibrio exalbescens]MDD7908885.1 Ppx/GppA phosphatase family protein [Pseudovibrio exalbescens]
MPEGLEGECIRGRFIGAGPVAIIDIGSNSIRLVVYERLSRSPTALFNEKMLAGLGRGLGQTGRLADDRVEAALKAITRYRAVCEHIGVTELRILATAAAREASNGPDFIRRVEEICGTTVQIFSGRDEAHYSAKGVVSGFWRADGMVGDLGGGSLELVNLDEGTIGHGMTFPLGGIRLQETAKRSLSKAAKIATTELGKADWLTEAQGRTFFAIGGTWRSLGRLHLFREGYPLHVMHDYSIPADAAIAFCERVMRDEEVAMRGIQFISKARRALLPYGATVMREVLLQSKAERVVFSALGVREGLLYEMLADDERAKDPLIEASKELGLLRARSPNYGTELVAWTNRLFNLCGVSETDYERRLRTAACHLSDIGWRAHPDYRGEQSLNVISNAGFVGIDHPGRAYLALSVFYRHEGLVDDAVSPELYKLCSERLLKMARILGASLRVASLLSASIEGVLPQLGLSLEEDKLVLTLPEGYEAFDGERLRKRLNQLSRLLDLDSEIVAAA